MKLNNKQKLSIFPAIFIALGVAFLLMTCSCSARKVNKSESQTKQTESIKATEVDSSKIETNTVIKDSSSTDEVTVEPADITKPMVINGRTYFNAVLKHKKTKASTNTTIDKKEQKAVKKEVVSNKSVEAKQSNKQTERTSFNWLWLLMFLAPIWSYRKEILKKIML